MTDRFTDSDQAPVGDTSIVTARALLSQHPTAEQSLTVADDGREGLATVRVLGARTAAAADAHLRFDALVQAALRRYTNEWAAGEHPAEVTS